MLGGEAGSGSLRPPIEGSLELEDMLLFLVVTSHLAGGLVQAEQWLPAVCAPGCRALGVLVETQLPLLSRSTGSPMTWGR